MSRDELFDNNIKLAYFTANKYLSFGLKMGIMDDLKQEALEGLWKACVNFQDKKGVKFSTFAITVINNQILMYLRKYKKQPTMLSLQQEIGDQIYLQNIIRDEKDYFGELYEEIETHKVKSLISNSTSKDMEVLKELMKGRTQDEVAREFKISQPHASRLKTRAVAKIQKELHTII